ncbi:ParA family protein [Pseudonocardiaceae bacterium YIM PH 21723]|nr:ParA family protein [Pseudonocardiaceae bacterium YIM PH 21723]
MSQAAIVALLAMKGGVGKTTGTLCLASASRAKGLRTLVVDLDPQRNTTETIINPDYLAAVAAARTRKDLPDMLVDLLEMENPTREDVLRAIHSGSDVWSGVDVLPASLSLASFEQGSPVMVTKLREILALISDLYDVILLDCPPSFLMLTTMAAYAAQIILVIGEPARFGLSGLMDTWKLLARLVEAGLPDLLEAAVIVNLYDQRESDDRVRFKEIAAAFKSIMWADVLFRRVVVGLAIDAGVPLHDYQDQPRYKDKRREEVTTIVDGWLNSILVKTGKKAA